MTSGLGDWIAAGFGAVYSEATVDAARPLGWSARRRVRRGIKAGRLPSDPIELAYAAPLAADFERMLARTKDKTRRWLVPLFTGLALIQALSGLWLSAASSASFATIFGVSAYTGPRRRERYRVLARQAAEQRSDVQRAQLTAALQRPAPISRAQLVAGYLTVAGLYFGSMLALLVLLDRSDSASDGLAQNLAFAAGITVFLVAISYFRGRRPALKAFEPPLPAVS